MQFEVTQQEHAAHTLSAEKLSAIASCIGTRGYAVVTGLISAETCELLAQSVLEDVARIRSAGELTPHEQRTAHGHLQLGLRRHAPFVRADVVANPLIESVVVRILGPGAWLGFYNGNVNCPDSGFQPWHFDRPFSWTSEAQATNAGQPWPPPTTTLSCSVALNDITDESGATEILPGTHRETVVTTWKPGDRAENHPDQIARWGPPATMPIPRGGVCFRDPRMWHRGVPNRSLSPRPMPALTWHSALAKHWRGLVVHDMTAADRRRCDSDRTLRLLDSGELGDGRLVFDASASPVFEASPTPHPVDRNVRFIEPPYTVNHLLDAHTMGGAKVSRLDQ